MKLIQISKENLYYIHRFVSNPELISPSFRYFQKRDILQAFSNHLYTIVGLNEEDEPIAYGHIDREEKNWLGICVLEPYKGRGYGKQMMKALLLYADTQNLELHLTVDKENTIAQALYSKMGFIIIEESETYRKMIRSKKYSTAVQ